MHRATINREKDLAEGQFVAVARPSRTEGVGRALQAAFRNRMHLSAELESYLERLECVRY